MNILTWGVLALSLLVSSTSWSQDPALGAWHTLDEDTGEVKSLVILSLAQDGTMHGKISQVLQKHDGNGLCGACEGEHKNQPIEGMTFIWGAKNTALGEWQEGQLLDPESGKVYNSHITIGDDPHELEVRGYVGIAMFGRSQTWQRAAQ